MSSRPVLCPSCRQGTLAESRPGKTSTIHRPGKAVRLLTDPVKRNTILLICPECGGVIEWPGKRIIIVDAA